MPSFPADQPKAAMEAYLRGIKHSVEGVFGLLHDVKDAANIRQFSLSESPILATLPSAAIAEFLSSQGGLVMTSKAREVSLGALAGALLQFGKQGISIVYGKDRVKIGRKICSQHVSVVIWEGRNQALHWEDNKFRKGPIECFETLAREVDQKFSQYTKRNMAWDVLQLLVWDGFDALSKDLSSLGLDPRLGLT